MAKGIPSFHGDRLKQAREARGLTGVNLASLIGVRPAAVSQYEHGTARPTQEMLDRVATALNMPATFFLRPVPSYPIGRFFYRSMSAATKAARTRAERRFEWLRDIAHYFEGYFDLPAVNLPKVNLPFSFRQLTNATIDSIASECRRHWGLREGPAPNLIRLLEKNGFVVSRCALDADTLDAFTEMDSAGRPFVILASDKGSGVRSRFDAAHELAHCVLHPGVEHRSLLSTQEHAQLEQQAHRFASAFLLPEEQFTRELVAPTLESFLALKERWKVSIGAMVMRASQLGLLRDQQSERLWINLGRRGWRKCEPLDDRILAEQPKLLKQCVDMVLGSKLKSRAQIADDLSLPPGDIEELAGLPDCYLQDGFGEVISIQFKPSEPRPEHQERESTVIPFKLG